MEIGDPAPVLIGIVAVIWGLFFVLFVVPVVRQSRRRQRDIAWLQAHGWRINVVVDRVDTQRIGPLSAAGRLAANPRHIIVAHAWDDPQGRKAHLFSSDPLSGTVADDLPGATVDVLVDPDNPNRYWMDVATLR